MRKLYLLLCVLIFWGFVNTAFASHVPAGTITYSCTGTNQYLVTLTLFENCSTGFGINGPKTITAVCGSSSLTFTLNQVSGPTEVSQLCPAQISNSQCANPSNPHPGIEKAVFTGTITLPYACDSWRLGFGLCCRNTSVNVSGQPSFYVETTLNNLDDPCNSSPYLTAVPVPYVCLNQPVNYNLGAVDPNGDSLSFALVAALDGPNVPVTYNPGFTAAQPIPGAAINAQTGQITFTPNQVGSYIFAVKIFEYDSAGNILTTILHDFRFEVITCVNQTPSSPSGMSGFSGNAVQTGPNSIAGCPGDNFCFNLTFSDPNLLDTLIVTSNVTSALPGATFTVSASPNPRTATICWTIPATATGLYTFTVTAKDNACPVYGQVTFPMYVDVIEGVSAGPDHTICGNQSAQLNATGGTSYTWSVVSGPPMVVGTNFSCNNCASPVATPTATTVYKVTSNLSANCSNVDTVIVTVVPDYPLSINPASSSICMNGIVQLNAVTNAASGPYTYQWSPATGLSSSTVSNPFASPLVTTTYTLTVSNTAGCTKTATATVTVTGVGPTVETTDDTTICLGQSVPITTNITLEPGFCGVATSPCVGITSTGSIGTGTLATDYAGPFYASSSPISQYALKHQYIYTAAELQAAGFATGGTITAIALDLSTANVTPFQNFTIKMGCTGVDNYPNGNYLAGLSTVYFSSVQNTPGALGWYTITLQSPYDWDGVSNIVVEFCSNGTVLTTSDRVRYTSTTPYYRSIYNYSTTGGCATAIGTRNYLRPNMRFTVCQRQITNPTFSWTPTAGLSNASIPNPVATPTTTTTYILNVTDQGTGCTGSATITIGVGPDYTLATSADQSICYGNNVQIQSTPSAAGSYSYTWSPALGLSSASVSNPNASPGITTQYAVEVSNGNCIKRDTVVVNVYGVPVTATISNDTVCPGEQVQLDVTVYPTSCGLNPVGCVGSSASSTIGNGTSGSSTFTPFYGSMEDSRIQYLYKATDLLSAGVTPGTITSLAWNITTKGSAAPFTGFTIKMGCATATDLSTTVGWLPTAGVVYGPVNYSSTTGWNVFNLTTAFNWDGTSNIVVEVCFDNTMSVGADQVEYTSAVGYYGTMRNSVNFGAGCSLNPVYRYMVYPNMKFTVCNPSMPQNAVYTWTPATGLSNPNIPNPVATINTDITYTITISDPSLPGCNSTASVTGVVDSTNYVVASNDTSICPGGSVQLNSTFFGPPPTSSIPCGVNNTSCTGPVNTMTIGTGTASNSQYSYPAVYGNWYWGAKHQILYRASELIAMGMQSGTVSEIAFNVAAINGVSTYNNITIKMGCTSQQSLTTWVSGLQTVYTGSGYNVTTGWNPHTLTSTFDWDGVSNLIVEFCFQHSNYTFNSSTYYTPTSYNSVLYYNADNSNVCSSPGWVYTSSLRPNTRFKICNAPPAVLTYGWTPAAGLSNTTIANPVATPSVTTTYVVTVYGAECDVSDTVEITVNQPPAITANGPTTFCQGDTVTLTSNIASNITWSTGATTQSIGAAASGTYTVTDNLCNLTSPPVNVTVNPSPQPTVTPSGTINICSGDNVVLTSSSSTGNLWSNGATTQSITVTTAGTYSVTVTGANGCTGTSAPVTVNVTPSNTPVITAGGPTTFCSGGSVTLTSSSSSNNTWSTGATTQSIIVTTPGTYTVSDNSTCGGTSAPVTVMVNTTPSPTVTAGGPTTFCSGGSVTLTSSAASGNTWSTGAGTQSITVTNSGSYSVSVTDANGCTGSSSPVMVTVNTTPSPAVTAGGPTTFCSGGSVTLTSNIANGNTWSNSATTQSISVTSSGSYSVTVTDANGCTGTSAAVNVTVNNSPSPTITAGGPTTFCSGGNVVLTSSTATGNTWSTGATTQSITVTTGGTYSVSVTDANGCTGTSNSITVNVNPNSIPSITAGGPTTFCSGSNVVLTSSINNNNVWSTGATTQSITVTTSGTYTVTDNSGCGGTSSPVTVTVNPTPSPTITAGGPTTFCSGGNVVLTSSSASGNTWSTGATTQNITVTTSGTYSVSVTNANGCTGTSNSITVTVNPNSIPTITAGGPTTFCSGNNVVLTSSISNNNTWSTGATTQSITVTASGTYTVTDNSGCGGTSSPVTVTVNNNPAPSVTAGGPTTFCQGGSVVLTSSSASGNTWSNSATTPSITVNSSGTYSVSVTDANGCSGTSAPVTVTVNNNPSPMITAGGPTTFCQGGSVTLTSSAVAGNTWSNGATTQSITVTGSGNYTVTVTDGNGCTGTSPGTAVTVNSNPAPVVTASGPTTFCQGGNVTLTSSAASGNTWSNSSTAQNITVSSAGNYSVTVTDGNGCTGTSAPVAVTVNNNPAPVATASGSTTFCQGDSVVLSSSYAAGNTWSNSGTSQNITVTTGGTYSVTVTDGNGCSGTSNSITVNVNPNSIPNITAGGPTTFCSGSNVVLTSSINNNNVWSTGATTQSITVTTSGTYTVTDNSGCGGTSSPVTVTVNPTPQPVITSNGPVSFCQGDSVVLSSNYTSGNAWSNSSAGQNITVTTSGTYSVTVTDPSGCAGTSNAVTVTVNPNSVPNVTAGGPTTFCSGGSVILTSSNSSNNTWSTGATTQSITVTTSGTYTVTDNSMCGGTSSPVSVTVNQSPQPVITASGPATFCQGGSVTLSSSSAAGNSWSTGSPSASINVTVSGLYTVTVTDANGCTGTSPAMQVTVNPNPVITMASFPPACFGDLPFALSGAAPAGGNYSGTGVAANTFDPALAGIGTHVITYTYTDANGCSGTSSANITVNGQQDAAITAAGPLCESDMPVDLSAASSGGSWSGAGITNTLTGEFSPSVAGAGTHQVIYSIPGSCGDTDTLSIIVYAAPSANAGPDQTIEWGASTNLNASGGTSYSWTPSGGLSCTNCPDPTAAPGETTTYYVTVTNANGCTSLDSVTVYIEMPDGELFVPNLFSPNGDGLNDQLFVFGNNIEYVTFTVYNRWGQKVFETNNIELGWDGTFNGKKLDPAVFVYYVRATYTAGREVTKSGNVTLVR
jgi:large repetitive protein